MEVSFKLTTTSREETKNKKFENIKLSKLSIYRKKF